MVVPSFVADFTLLLGITSGELLLATQPRRFAKFFRPRDSNKKKDRIQPAKNS
jgi:hypothetical protein